MPLHGQASGGWTESSSALRILNLGVRNTLATLTDDAFTQSNPTAVATNVSTRVDTTIHGVLSGSVCFARPDAGPYDQFVGGPGSDAVQTALAASPLWRQGYRPLGLFINSAVGNAYENTPGVASGLGPYVCAMGTYGDALYETHMIGDAVGGDPPAGTAIRYVTGQRLISSRNGFLMPATQLNLAGAAIVSTDDITVAAESFVATADNQSTVIGVLKMVPDATQAELVFDARL